MFSPANVSESKGDRVADPESRKRRLRSLPPHNRCRMGIASTASDGIQSRLDEYQQKELENQDRKGLSREVIANSGCARFIDCAPDSRSSAASSSITTFMVQSFVDVP